MGKYLIEINDKGSYYFNLLAGNNEPILHSQMYKARKGALKGIASITKNADIAPVEDQTVEKIVKERNPKFQLYQGKDEKFYFRLVAGNGQAVGRSEGYNSKAAAKNGIESVKKNSVSPVETKKD